MARFFVGLVAFSAALGGCGGTAGEERKLHAAVTQADLATMVVRKGGLGWLVTGLAVDGDSGPSDNADAPESTVDPKDTPRKLARAGRIRGHHLTFARREKPRSSRAGRVLFLGTEVELFRDERTARAYLKKQVADYLRFRGRKLDGVKLARSESFDVGGLGEEAAGLQVTVTAGDAAVFATIVGFRRGRVVANASVGMSVEREVGDEVERIARTLDNRVERVLAGELRNRRVAR